MELATDRPIIAVDLGGTNIRVAVVHQGRIVGRMRLRTPAHAGPSVVVDSIQAAVRAAVEQVPQLDLRQAVLGLAAPGPLNGAAGVVYRAPNLRDWHDVPLTAMLQARVHLPVSLIKDANAAALAEHRFGAGRGTDTMLYVTVSTGIGGGVILGGRLFDGVGGTAGEIGHVTIDDRGVECTCGNIGCIETVASGAGLARLAAAHIAAGTMAAPGGDVTPNAEQIIAAALAGDDMARALLERAGRALGLALVGQIHLFNPEAIVLGGGLLNAGSLLLDPMRRALEQHTMAAPWARVAVHQALLADDAGLWGAALHVSEQHYA